MRSPWAATERLGTKADDQLCQACHARTGGNPFLLEALASALHAPGDGDLLARVDCLGPEPVAQAVLRRVGQLGDGAGRLTRALAVLGGPAPLRHAAALAGQDASAAARLADSLRGADVLAPGSVLEFAHPIVRTAVHDAIPPGERALAHAEAARLLDGEGADPERIALHLLHSEPDGNPHVTAVLRAAAAAASGRGAPGLAADYLRRALEEPPDPAARPAVLLELGLVLASERNPAAVTALRQAVGLTRSSRDRAAAALLAARVLGIWGYHDSVTLICRDALASGRDLGPAADCLEAELFASSFISAATASEAWALAGNHLADPGVSSMWRVYDAVFATGTARPASDALARLAPVLAGGFAEIPPDSLAAVYALLVLIWNGDLGTAGTICNSVLSAARMYAYSPLHALRPGISYPATLILTGDHDDRVAPAHSYKFGAELQHDQASDAPVLLRIEAATGHGLGKPKRMLVAEFADMLAFAAEHTGLTPG